MVNCSKERMSFATFLFPKYDGELGPASSLVDEKTQAQYKTTGVKDHLKGFFGRKLDGKSYVDSKRTNL
ncbi:putative codeine 3-O-demethylase [Lupinus albus]|uniref:Putative codeine 3-O-demethylase n=1 Tax=Lupinus albus TaxID=3870 RepID=A0A6A4NVM2_LUPAL|nr:putative codeine 3-O-demethylase [Lupinus albus]